MDVSADLTELGRTPVAVVCAGVKSVLDIPRTLEYLETQARMRSCLCTPGRAEAFVNVLFVGTVSALSVLASCESRMITIGTVHSRLSAARRSRS